jgi:hypothetical protein
MRTPSLSLSSPPTHSLTRSLTHSLAHSLSHSLTHSLHSLRAQSSIGITCIGISI